MNDDAIQPLRPSQPTLTVFSSPLCGPCERMKTWLTERDYSFVVRDVMMDEEAGEKGRWEGGQSCAETFGSPSAAVYTRLNLRQGICLTTS